MFDEAVRILKPGGILVVKSRSAAPVLANLTKLVEKELVMRAVRYDDFATSMDWLGANSAEVGKLVGETFPYEQFESAFEAARESEQRKVFIRVGEDW